MSSMFSPSLPSSSRAVFRRKVWGQIFGQLIQGAREQEGRSAEEAARLAGMKAWEWEEVEAGQVPKTWEELDALGNGLQASRSWMGSIAILCAEAWGK